MDCIDKRSKMSSKSKPQPRKAFKFRVDDMEHLEGTVRASIPALSKLELKGGINIDSFKVGEIAEGELFASVKYVDD